MPPQRARTSRRHPAALIIRSAALNAATTLNAATALIAALVLVLAGSLVACGAAATSTGGSGQIRIGLLFPTTGSMSDLGTDQSNGAKLMLDWANSHGGIAGKKIKIFQGDAQSSPGVATTVAQRLIDQDQVQVIIGSYSSGIAQAVAPVAQRNKVVLWEVGAVAPTVAQPGDRYFLRTLGAAATYATADLDFLQSVLAPKLGVPLGAVRVAIAHEDGPFGTSVADAISAEARSRGVTIVTKEAYPETSPDLTPMVLRLKAANPDVLLITPLVASTPLFWQDARTQNLTVRAVIGSAGFSSSAFVQKFGAKGVDGVYDVEAPAVAMMNSDHLTSDAKQALDGLRASFKATYGHDCLVHCGDGLGGAYILVKDVLPRAAASGAVTGDSIRNAAAKTDLPTGATPQGFGVKFDDKGDNERAASVIMQWQNGSLVVVFPQQLAVADPMFPMPTWSQR
jgi:branched-chain amino acid transport system substrate-binding protein